MVTKEERAALLAPGLFGEDEPMMDQTAAQAKAEEQAVSAAEENRNDRKARDRAMEFLGGNVLRLCKVRFAASYLLANKAERFHAELPAGDGDDFRDYLLEEVRIYAGQFPQCGKVPKRAEVTAALQEVIDDTK